MNRIYPFQVFAGILCFLVAGLSNVSAQPVIVGTIPSANRLNVPRNSPVVVDFNQTLSAGSASSLRVFSNQRGGMRAGSSGTTTVAGSRLSFIPTYAFWPGETVQAVVTRTAQSSTGSLAQPRAYQFTTATTNGSGVFNSRGDVAVGQRPYIVKTADVDGDGDLDILTASFYDNTVSIRLNNGNGAFSGTTDVPVSGQPRGLVLVDLDADGDLDFATANYGNDMMSVRLNNGAGGFSGNGEYSVGGRPQSIAASDIDGDGDQDLLVSNESSSDIKPAIN